MALNVWTGIGNLGQDPEIKTMSNGKKVANFSIAITKRWTDKSGEKKEKTLWVRCVSFARGQGGGLPGVIERFLHKGSKVYISGKLVMEKYTDKQGVEKESWKVDVDNMEMLDSRQEGPTEHQKAKSNGYVPPPQDDFDHDEIPF